MKKSGGKYCVVCKTFKDDVINHECLDCFKADWADYREKQAKLPVPKWRGAKQRCTKCKTFQHGVLKGVCERCDQLTGLGPLNKNPEVFPANRADYRTGDGSNVVHEAEDILGKGSKPSDTQDQAKLENSHQPRQTAPPSELRSSRVSVS